MKRANGTGSVVKLSGNRRRPWAVKVSGRNQYGHVIQQIISYHEKASEAQLALEEYNRTRALGSAPAVGKLSLTVGDVFEAWKAKEYRKPKPASISSHNAAWNKRFSRFASRKMRDLTLDELQALLNEDEDAGLSQSSINNDALLIRVFAVDAVLLSRGGWRLSSRRLENRIRKKPHRAHSSEDQALSLGMAG